MSKPFPAGCRTCVVGATSSIARALTRRLAERDAVLHLAGRDEAALARMARDLNVRSGTQASTSRFEATQPEHPERLIDAATAAMGGVDIVFVAVGMLGDQRRAERDPKHLRAIVDVNFTSVAHLLTLAANRLESPGMIVALSSVAGDRGRPSNYAYGSAKAGLTAFLDGLRGRLHDRGIHVLTVKPGPVDTRMTWGVDASAPYVADPGDVADDVVRAMIRHDDVCYTPGFWRYVMRAIQLLPASLFKRMNL